MVGEEVSELERRRSAFALLPTVREKAREW